MSRKTIVAKFAFAAALPLCLAAAPVAAQVQPGNPNAANQSMSNMSTSRSMQQEQTGQNNTTMMNMERSQNAPPTPAPPLSGGPVGTHGR